jgi:hypothetical protein
MTEITKQAKPKLSPTSKEPPKSQPALEEKELDKVTGGSIAQACATGKHFPKVVITS